MTDTDFTHLPTVTVYTQSVNGDSGDNRVSPFDEPLISEDDPTVTAVTDTSIRAGRHRSSGDSSGDSSRSLSPDIRPQRRISWTARELSGETFPPVKWVVQGIIPEGLSLLAARPKAGKSWLALGIAIAKAAGGRAFGSIPVKAGSALYLALEDNGRRLQSRQEKILQGAEPPRGLTYVIEAPRLSAGGLDRIESWLNRTTDPGIVIVDVLEKFRDPMNRGQTAYAADYQAISGLKLLADVYHTPVLLLHHDRKGASDDFLAEVSGTYGLTGGADTVLGLKRVRGELDGVLHVTGRDVEEQEYAFRLDVEHGAWTMLGLASEHGLPETRRKILGFLRLHEGAKPSEIALGLGIDRKLANQTCRRMADDQQLDTDDHGRYFAPQPLEES